MKQRSTPQLDAAAAFLERELRRQPAWSRDLYAQADELGITPATLKKAADALGVDFSKPKGHNAVLWTLPRPVQQALRLPTELPLEAARTITEFERMAHGIQDVRIRDLVHKAIQFEQEESAFLLDEAAAATQKALAQSLQVLETVQQLLDDVREDVQDDRIGDALAELDELHDLLSCEHDRLSEQRQPGGPNFEEPPGG